MQCPWLRETAAPTSRFPVSWLVLLEAAAGLLLLIALATPERMKPGIEGVGGGIEEASAIDVDEPAPPDPVPAVETALAPETKPLIPANAAPAATAPARTMANAVEPTSPEMTRLAMNGITATARA